MNKKYIIIILLLIYIIFYKIFLSSLGQMGTYIINPLIWIAIAIVCHFSLGSNNKRFKNQNMFISIMTVVSLIYVISYYGFGIIAGYTNNPFSTTISGIIINLFSLWIVICLKEYIRYLFLHIKIKHKISYFVFLFLVFFLSDISLVNILNNNSLLDLLAKELLIPMIVNLLMMYLSYISDFKAAIITRSIILLPSLFFRVTPDYEWFVIMIFNIAFGLISYLTLQYFINKNEKDIPSHLVNNIHPRRWIISTTILFITIAFGAGFFNIKPVVILTGSMKPLINPGDMVVINTENINSIIVGDIIEFKVDDKSVVHRVIEIVYRDGNKRYITKGDANKKEDAFIVTNEQLVGKLIFNIPYIGYPTYLIKNIVNNNDEVGF